LVKCGGDIGQQIFNVVLEKVVALDLDWEYFVDSYKVLDIKGKEIEIVLQKINIRLQEISLMNSLPIYTGNSISQILSTTLTHLSSSFSSQPHLLSPTLFDTLIQSILILKSLKYLNYYLEELLKGLMEIIRMYYSGEEAERRKVLAKYVEMVGNAGVKETKFLLS
jgi:hypothetical protein